MATVSVTVPAGVVNDVLAAFQQQFPDEWIKAQSQGQSAAQFTQARVAAYVESVYRQYKLSQVPPPSPPPAGVS